MSANVTYCALDGCGTVIAAGSARVHCYRVEGYGDGRKTVAVFHESCWLKIVRGEAHNGVHQR